MSSFLTKIKDNQLYNEISMPWQEEVYLREHFVKQIDLEMRIIAS